MEQLARHLVDLAPQHGRQRVRVRDRGDAGRQPADQRGVIVADSEGGDLVGVITSANPHDASSLHSNVAWRFTGELALRAVESEIKIARLSGWHGDFQQPILPPPLRTDRPILEASFVTEGAIPFAARDPLRVVPCLVAGSIVTGAISLAANVKLMVPHGGVFVLLIPHAVERLGIYLVAIVAGTVVTAGVLYLVKRPLLERS